MPIMPIYSNSDFVYNRPPGANPAATEWGGAVSNQGQVAGTVKVARRSPQHRPLLRRDRQYLVGTRRPSEPLGGGSGVAPLESTPAAAVAAFTVHPVSD